MWRALTEADLLSVLNAPETEAYQAAAAADGQDVIAGSITLVVNQCRGYIADNAANSLEEGLTLPERVHLSALHLVRVEMLTRLDIEVSKDRETAKRDAIRFFERVSDGRVAIEQPTGTVDQSSSSPTVEVISSNEQVTNRQTLAGL